MYFMSPCCNVFGPLSFCDHFHMLCKRYCLCRTARSLLIWQYHSKRLLSLLFYHFWLQICSLFCSQLISLLLSLYLPIYLALQSLFLSLVFLLFLVLCGLCLICLLFSLFGLSYSLSCCLIFECSIDPRRMKKLGTCVLFTNQIKLFSTLPSLFLFA